MVTERSLKLKRLSKGGTLLSIGVDMELAQALGAGDSFLPTNEPLYSRIHVETAEEIIEYFVRSCYTHAKRCEIQINSVYVLCFLTDSILSEAFMTLSTT